jgi:hypothetical protein
MSFSIIDSGGILVVRVLHQRMIPIRSYFEQRGLGCVYHGESTPDVEGIPCVFGFPTGLSGSSGGVLHISTELS